MSPTCESASGVSPSGSPVAGPAISPSRPTSFARARAREDPLRALMTPGAGVALREPERGGQEGALVAPDVAPHEPVVRPYSSRGT